LFAGAGVASALSASHTKAQSSSTVQKLDYDGKPASGGGFITPLIIHNVQVGWQERSIHPTARQ